MYYMWILQREICKKKKKIVWCKKVCEWVYTLLWKDACYLNKSPIMMCLAKKKKKINKQSVTYLLPVGYLDVSHRKRAQDTRYIASKERTSSKIWAFCLAQLKSVLFNLFSVFDCFWPLVLVVIIFFLSQYWALPLMYVAMVQTLTI